MASLSRVALLGAGVIGAGWAARLIFNGIDVAIVDQDRDVQRKLGDVLAAAERVQKQLFGVPKGRRGRLTFHSRIAEAVAGADLIQESAPENEELKRNLLAEASFSAPPEALIASSTSGLLPSRLQRDCRHPDRVLVGHPFNPVYLLPLVEICGGAETSDHALRRAADFYTGLGMHALILRREVDGFIADRLMEALWREALHLINDGVASADEIDRAVIYGPGLRWAFMGTFLTYRLGGGDKGMRHFLEQFGPTLKLPWSKLEAPELSQALIERLWEQSDEQAAGRSVRELERLRDDCLVAILGALADQNYAAGALLNRAPE